MKKRLINFQTEKFLSANELYQIKGGRVRRGPGDLIDSDIDIPDLTLSSLPGPGELIDSDIDIPDITLGATRNRSFKNRFNTGIF